MRRSEQQDFARREQADDGTRGRNMISKWKLSNFKSVRQETDLALGPLTIFAGSNSSGKSTLLQSILLISQTLAAKIPSQSVVLNGHLAKLGQFNDLRSFGSKTGRVTMGWELRVGQEGPQGDEGGTVRKTYGSNRRGGSAPSNFGRPTLKSVSYEISLNVDSRGRQSDLQQLQPNLSHCRVSCVSESHSAHSARTGDATDLTYSLFARRNKRLGAQGPEAALDLGIPTESFGTDSQQPTYKVTLDRNSLNELGEELAAAEPVDCHFTYFLPDRLLVRFDEAEEEARLVALVICTEGLHYTTHATRSVADKSIVIQPNVVALLKSYLGEELINAVLNPFLQDPSFDDGLLENAPQPTFTISDWQEGVRKLRSTRRTKLRRKIQEVAQEMGPEIQKALKQEKESQYNTRPQRLPGAMWEATKFCNTFFRDSVKYLGPLRDEPKALYSLASAADPKDVGLRGENTAAVLHLHKDLDVRYIPSAKFSAPAVAVEPSTHSLGEAVVDWAQYLEVAEKIGTTDMGKLGHELRVSSSDADPLHDLTHVGVGVSQILPILVMCLLAGRGTVLVLEQPELHLHPRVQTRLADFFLSMSLLGKQCLIETHSEYLINRLRFRAASAPHDEFSSGVKMYFAEKKDGTSSFREVKVNEYGAITDWPEGFFDQSPREAENILRAAVAKRKKEREGRKYA